MGICRIDAAEQEWRESWEPTLPLVAPAERVIGPRVRTGQLAGDWEEAARHLAFMVRLVYWVVNTEAQGDEIRADAEVREAIERVERLVLHVTNNVLDIPYRTRVGEPSSAL
jgi:hypothetical protein